MNPIEADGFWQPGCEPRLPLPRSPDGVASLAGRSILIVGDLILDEYIWGQMRRISPEAPVPIVELQSRTYRLGGAANVAANVTGLGSRAMLVGAVGTDGAGDRLLDELARNQIDASGVVRNAGHPTTVKTRIIAHQQQVLRLDVEETSHLTGQLEHDVLAYIRRELPQVDAVIVSDYAKGVLSAQLLRSVLRSVQQLKKPAIVDPNGTDYRVYEGATIVKPNLRELERLFGREIRSEEELFAAGRQLCSVLPETALLVTLGCRGMLLFRDGEPPRRFSAQSREVYDVTGAGDTAVATLTLSLTAGFSLGESAELANHAAGITVSQLGAVAVRPKDLLSRPDELASRFTDNRLSPDASVKSRHFSARLRPDSFPTRLDRPDDPTDLHAPS